MAKGFLQRLFSSHNQRTISRMQQTAEQINTLESQFTGMPAEALRAKTQEFRDRLASGATLDELLPEAFAAVREASRRTTGLRHYDVQLIGGMILHSGQVVEMRTGEGKTLVATLPLYLNALSGRGAHLVTPNDYLAKFGVQWMGPIYYALGVSVSVIQSGAGRPDEASFLYDPTYVSDDDRYQYLRPITRREAYTADVTYGTNNEFGFDYLRDNMVIDISQCTQRELAYAIVDEVDSILIDEARTPLIISGPAEESSDLYRQFSELVQYLHADTDYELDERSQIVILSEEGVAKVESMMHIPAGESLYDSQHAYMLPYLDNALRAKEFFRPDKEYVVRDGEIIIVDEFTGRLMYGRRYSEGLHQAIEAKAHVEVRRESLTYATITFQNFFRMYEKLAGMTGTALTEAEELRKIYDLDVAVLPTNVEYRAQFGDLQERQIDLQEAGVEFSGVVQEGANYRVTVFDGPANRRYYRRLDTPDRIYKTEQAKFTALIDEIERTYQAGRPVLVGTTAIETSERLSKLLSRRRIPHEVLNAKYHEKEAVIIAQAGQPGAVTIATNMAGRGVDILLGGNPEGMARDQLRKEDIDLTLIPSADWEQALRQAQAGEDPTTHYPERWAEVIRDKVRQCEADRRRVYSLGGLHVIGTERHEARRIDNQLRGRAGRQGDPGSSRFYISLEDELMRRFGGERLKPWMDRAGLEEEALEFAVLAKAITSVQERVEGYNFDIRKHVLEYDNVVNKQRTVVYAERRKILSRDDLHDDIMDMVETEIRRLVHSHLSEGNDENDLNTLLSELRRFIPLARDYKPASVDPDALVAELVELADRSYWRLNTEAGEGIYQSLRQQEQSLKAMEESRDPALKAIAVQAQQGIARETLEAFYDQPLRRLPPEAEEHISATFAQVYRLYRDRRLMLQQLDEHWVRHLTSLDMLREGIGLRAVAQQNPLVAYQKEAFEMYQDMLSSVQAQLVRSLFLVPQAPTRQRRQPITPPRQMAFRASGGSSQPSASQPDKAKQRPGRNAPCWCGSGKKYKDCHYRSDQQSVTGK